MTRHIHDRTYRSTAELIRAIRDEHLLTQHELARRTGFSRYQLCRWEKGSTREPSLAAMRRVLGAFGLAVTFGVEPSTAALDEQLEPGMEAMGLDCWLLANRVIWPVLSAGVPMVVGGELAAGLQGIPIEDPEMVLHLRLGERPPIDVPVVPLVELRESGMLGSAAAALAERWLPRTG